ncbi:MAG: hypothetical protein F6I01_002135 [Aerococcus sanguinicola]
MYGGTAEEMARLVNESGVLNGEFEATAENVRDIPFDVLIEAIHKTQENLGVTGTTAQEAAETVSGSFEQMKAAAENWLSSLGNPKANMDQLTQEVIQSAEVFAKNIKRVLSTIWDNLPIPDWSKWLIGFTAVTGPIITGMGLVLVAISQVIGAVSSISGAFKAASGGLKAFSGGFKAVKTGGEVASGFLPQLGAKFASFGGASGLASKATGLLGKALGFLTGPVGIAVGAIAAVIGVLAWLYQTNDTAREMMQNAWQAIQDAVGSAIEGVRGFIMDIFGRVVEWWNENQQNISNVTSAVWGFIKEVISNALTVLGHIITAFMSVITPILTVGWEAIKLVIQLVWEQIKAVISIALEIILGVIQIFFQILNGDWSGAWNTLVEIFKNIWEILQGYLSNVLEIFKSTFGGALSFISNLWSSVWSAISGFFSSIWEGIKSTVSAGVNFVKNIINTVFNWIKNFITTIWNGIKNITSSVWNGIRNTISNILNNVKSTFSNIFNSLRGIVSNAFNRVRSAVTSGMQSALNAVTGFLGRFAEAGRNIVGNIADGIRGAIGVVTGAIGDVLQAVRNYLPFSPPKDPNSPLRDIHKNGIGTQIAAGIRRGKDVVMEAMDELLDLPDAEVGANVTAFRRGNVNYSDGQVAAYSSSNGQGTTGFLENRFEMMMLESLDLIISILKELLDKDPDVYIDGEKASDILHYYYEKRNREKTKFDNRRRGVVT